MMQRLQSLTTPSLRTPTPPGCSVAYMGFLMGSLGGARGGGADADANPASVGTSLADPRHTLRRLFARDPGCLEDLLATTIQGLPRARARKPSLVPVRRALARGAAALALCRRAG